MAVGKNNHMLLRTYDVLRFKGKVWMVAPVSTDATSAERKFPELYINLTPVNADGTLGYNKQFGRDEVLREAQYIDNAKVGVHVQLPEDIQQQLADYEKQDTDLRTEEDELEGRDDSHPSYGAIKLSRISGHAKLFMSPFRHQHFIGISISRAVKKRSLAEDHMYSGGREIIEVFLSEAQFARFITNPADGNGTPCTLHHITGTYMPEPPYQDEKEKFQEDVKASTRASVRFLADAIEEVRALLSKKSISMKDKEHLLNLMEAAKKRLDDSLPFITKQMTERMEKIVSQAATEVDAYVNRLAGHLGMKELTGKEPPIRMLNHAPTPELPPKE